MEQEIASQIVGLGGSTDFSLLSLFLRADFVVKSVIIILIAASIYSWALIFDKYRLFKKINSSILDFENKFWKAKSAENFDNNLPAKSNELCVLVEGSKNKLICVLPLKTSSFLELLLFNLMKDFASVNIFLAS